MLSLLASLLRLASIAICLIVIASFAIFVVNQTSSASTHQQEEVSGRVATQSTQKTPTHESTVHKTIDDASNELTSPFSDISSGWSSQWAIRGADLLLALIVYGFGLGFLARVVRVRT